MIAIGVIIKPIINMIFSSIFDLYMRVRGRFVMIVTSQKPSWVISNIISKLSQREKYACNQCCLEVNNMYKKWRRAEVDCNWCDNKAKNQNSLQKYIRSLHVGQSYDCNGCDFMETQLGSLKHHFLTKHVGKRYDCNQRHCKVTSNDNLQKHNGFAHESIIYVSNECYYSET